MKKAGMLLLVTVFSILFAKEIVKADEPVSLGELKKEFVRPKDRTVPQSLMHHLADLFVDASRRGENLRIGMCREVVTVGSNNRSAHLLCTHIRIGDNTRKERVIVVPMTRFQIFRSNKEFACISKFISYFRHAHQATIKRDQVERPRIFQYFVGLVHRNRGIVK